MADKVVLDGELSPVLPFDGDLNLSVPMDGEVGIITNIGGGGTPAVLVEKSVSANGVYNASADSADGYSKVTVSVPASAVDSGSKTITTNGTHDVVGYASAEVNVPTGITPTGTKSITANGTHDVTSYASADVNVPNTYTASDEGKVVSNGALVGQTSLSVTENDTYDTTTVNEVTVNVSGGGGSYQKKTGSFTVASDYTYTLTNMGGTYTGSIVVSTGLTTIDAIMVWSEEWEDDTETAACFGSAVFYNCGFPTNADVKAPANVGAGTATIRQNSTTKYFVSNIAGIVPPTGSNGLAAGSFGLKCHSGAFPIKAGHTIRWEATGT